ncbi:MAG: HlyC/CorC family transporter [Chloroflexi bacterium]|jgi:CBS domain containing-hemolysin-like protein|nr:MAG: HlyC/CorC family transporter [Chloroflexota bacterium]
MDDVFSISGRLVLVLALVAANGLFVAAEFAIVTTRRARIDNLAAQGNPVAAVVRRSLNDLGNFLAAAQLGITMASIGLGFVGEPLLADLIEPAFSFLPKGGSAPAAHTVAVPVAFALITAMHIVLGEQAPKVLALRQPERIALLTAAPTQAFRYSFWPAIWLLNALANITLRPFGLRPADGIAHSVHTAEEINLLVSQSAEAGVLESEEAKLLASVFQFGDRRVNEVMIPRTEVVWLERGTAIRDFYRTFAETPHSRFPVFENSQDNVVGIVGIKDVLRGVAEGQLTEDSPIDLAMRPAMFTPETKLVGTLFFEMQRAGHQMAIVVDEYGGTAGIVTLEMLLEELVGYVSDELRRHEDEFVTVDEHTFQIDAGMTIHDANEQLGLNLPEGDYETVAGFVLSRLGHIPREGEQFTHNGLGISVTRVLGHKVEEVTVTRI